MCGCPLMLNSLSLHSVLLCVSTGISRSQIQSRLTLVCIQLLDLLTEKPRLKRGWCLSPGMWENTSGLAGRDLKLTEFAAVCNRPKRVPQTEQIFHSKRFFRLFARMLLTPDTQLYKNTSGGESLHRRLRIQLFVNTRPERVMLCPLSCDGFYRQRKVKRCQNT